jgi:two-component system chemotaxis response regulator CheB
VSAIEQSGTACKKVASFDEALHVIAVALSAGGLLPLRRMLAQLPWDLPAAVVVAQHLRGISYLPAILRPTTKLVVKLAEAGEALLPGTVYVGPPDQHVIVTADARLQVVDRPSLSYRPSADWLFESAAGAYADRAVAVVLSGRLSDGARGAVRVRRTGGRVFVQDPETCQFPDMPIATVQTGASEGQLSPEGLASAVVAAVSGRAIKRQAGSWRAPSRGERAG